MSERSFPEPPAQAPERDAASDAAGGAVPGAGGIDIVVNGEPRQVAAGTTVAALLVELGLADRRVAVERNREVVPRADHARTVLASGDQLELVTFVGGG